MLRKKKQFAWPKKLYDKPRILEENVLVTRYGLKNKKEIWKADAKVTYFRSRAKSLITAEQDVQQVFFGKLNELGLKVQTVADVLALNKEDILKRRLPTIVFSKGLAKTPKEARQMVVHKRVLINGRVTNVPSYLVTVAEENAIAIRPRKERKPKVEAAETSEAPAEEAPQAETVEEGAEEVQSG